MVLIHSKQIPDPEQSILGLELLFLCGLFARIMRWPPGGRLSRINLVEHLIGHRQRALSPAPLAVLDLEPLDRLQRAQLPLVPDLTTATALESIEQIVVVEIAALTQRIEQEAVIGEQAVWGCHQLHGDLRAPGDQLGKSAHAAHVAHNEPPVRVVDIQIVLAVGRNSRPSVTEVTRQRFYWIAVGAHWAVELEIIAY